MPEIDQINVPQGLWEKLVEKSAIELADLILFDAQEAAVRNDLDIDSGPEREGLRTSTLVNDEILDNCTIALIRMQTGNYTSSDDEVKHSEEYLAIWNAAADIAEHINYDALPPKGHLRAIAIQHIGEIVADQSSLS